MTILLSILLSGIAYMIIGMLWYSPLLFGKQWIKLAGKKEEDLDKSNMAQILSLSFLASLVIALVLNTSLQVEYYTFAQKLIYTFVLWGGLTFIPAFINTLYLAKPLKLVFIDTGYMLVSLLTFALIFNLMGSVPNPKDSGNVGAGPGKGNQTVMEDYQKEVVFTGTIATGSDLNVDYCEEGLYVINPNGLSPATPDIKQLLLQDADGMLDSEDLVGKEVKINGIYPYQEVFCEALICACEDYLFVNEIQAL